MRLGLACWDTGDVVSATVDTGIATLPMLSDDLCCAVLVLDRRSRNEHIIGRMRRELLDEMPIELDIAARLPHLLHQRICWSRLDRDA
jgi:hypothetical protein